MQGRYRTSLRLPYHDRCTHSIDSYRILCFPFNKKIFSVDIFEVTPSLPTSPSQSDIQQLSSVLMGVFFSYIFFYGEDVVGSCSGAT